MPIHALPLAFASLVSLSQPPQPPTATRRPGPGDPLPRFEIRAGLATLTTNEPYVVEGGFDVRWGDLQITGVRCRYDPTTLRLEAVGGVTVRRGDEVLTGESLTADGRAGLFELRQATADSPPFFFRGARILRTTDALIVEEGVLLLGDRNQGEIRLRGREIRLERSGRLILRDATLSVFRTPLIRLRHLSVPIETDPRNADRQRSAAPPVTFRISRISGVTFGLGNTVTLARNLTADLLGEISGRRGLQYRATVGRTLFGPASAPLPRRLVRLPGEVAIGPDGPPSGPLRQILTARPGPVTPDPVLDYSDILTTGLSLSRPTRATERRVTVDFGFFGNQEFAVSRFGPMLLSRLPEAEIRAVLPLSRPDRTLDWRNNALARRALRSPRVFLRGEATVGDYREVRLNEESRRIDSHRISGLIGVGIDPLLLGDRFLLSGETRLRSSRYADRTEYRQTEFAMVTALLPTRGTMLGGAYIVRETGGTTPFFFDRVDTQNEAQLRGQIGLNNGRFTLATLGRIDTRQGRLFDLEFGFAIRGSILEPRFTYHKLNGAFNLTVALPGLTGP
ncbi:MAG: hypothetical protein SFU56_11655 [Capsulimonadales bacterium]|nr:hypothetical protein [Capsulimonadales bacterium]